MVCYVFIAGNLTFIVYKIMHLHTKALILGSFVFVFHKKETLMSSIRNFINKFWHTYIIAFVSELFQRYLKILFEAWNI